MESIQSLLGERNKIVEQVKSRRYRIRPLKDSLSALLEDKVKESLLSPHQFETLKSWPDLFARWGELVNKVEASPESVVFELPSVDSQNALKTTENLTSIGSGSTGVEVAASAAKLGMVYMAANPFLSVKDLSYIVKNIEADTVIFHPKYRDIVNSLKGEIGGLMNFIVLGDPVGGELNYEKQRRKTIGNDIVL